MCNYVGSSGMCSQSGAGMSPFLPQPVNMLEAEVSRLRNARLAMGLSQEALSRRTSVGRTTIAHAEGGKHVPQADHAAVLYRAVGLDLDDMLADMGAKRVPRDKEITIA